MAKEEKKKNKTLKIVVYFFILLCLGVSIAFSTQLELIFKLKPDTSSISRENDFEVHFIDVGQGDSMAIRFSNGKTMLVDSGPTSGESNLKTYLNNVFFKGRERKFDYILLSHSDADHSGNMEFVLHNYAVETFYRPYIFNKNENSGIGLSLSTSEIEGYTKTINYLKANNIKTEFFKAGDKIVIGSGAVIDFYAPVNLGSATVAVSTNDYSPIMVISDNGKKVCLTGDASSDVEQDAMDTYDLPDVDLLKLGHHGSKYSTSMAFLIDLQPEYIVAQVGKNSYGHPSSDVLGRMAEYDANYNKTTYNGFLNNKDDDNIIYHSLLDEDGLQLLLIADMDSFLFMDWYIIVIILAGVITFIFFFPKTKKYTKRKNRKRTV